MRKRLLSMALFICLVLTQCLYVFGSNPVGGNGEVETPEMDLTEKDPENVDPPDSPGEGHAPGWHKEEGEWYYYETDGTKRTDGWAKDSAGWCWMDGSGRITRNKWIKDGNEWYFLKANGYMAANEWTRDSGGWYWMNGSGKITRSQWIQTGGKWYYLGANGYMVTGTQRIGGKTYRFSTSGVWID